MLARPDLSHRSRLVAGLLCFFFGVFGVHRFYVGKIGTGILMLATFGGLGIWYLIDLILILAGEFRDVEGRYVHEWLEPHMLNRQDNLEQRLREIERRLGDTQEIAIDLNDKFEHWQGHGRARQAR